MEIKISNYKSAQIIINEDADDEIIFYIFVEPTADPSAVWVRVFEYDDDGKSHLFVYNLEKREFMMKHDRMSERFPFIRNAIVEIIARAG